MKFTLTEYETLAVVLDYWLDNVTQEDTSQDEYLRVKKMLDQIRDALL